MHRWWHDCEQMTSSVTKIQRSKLLAVRIVLVYIYSAVYFQVSFLLNECFFA